jgi:hypothetical protein
MENQHLLRELEQQSARVQHELLAHVLAPTHDQLTPRKQRYGKEWLG